MFLCYRYIQRWTVSCRLCVVRPHAARQCGCYNTGHCCDSTGEFSSHLNGTCFSLCYTPCLEFVKSCRFHWSSELINMRDWREVNFISQVNIKAADSMGDWLHGRQEMLGSWCEYRFSHVCCIPHPSYLDNIQNIFSAFCSFLSHRFRYFPSLYIFQHLNLYFL